VAAGVDPEKKRGQSIRDASFSLIRLLSRCGLKHLYEISVQINAAKYLSTRSLLD
jgi:hypothetical protein